MIATTAPRLARRRVIASTLSLLASPAIVRAQGQNGVALVIGNSKYRWEAQLPNVRRDAPDIARRFQELGLRTELVQDASQDALGAAVGKFRAAAVGANLAAFYYAGHGASWDQRTYLVPVDADLGTAGSVSSLLSVDVVAQAAKGAAHRLFVFDSCRNNPADGWRQRAAVAASTVNELVQVAVARENAPNTLILFSTAPGRTALDGPAGANSPFAAALLRQLNEPAIDLHALPAQLRRQLLIATEGRQVVWDSNTFAGPFRLKGPGGKANVGLSVDPSRIVELRNAYDFARQKQLLLPDGLIALRPQSASPHTAKIGAFESSWRAAVGAARLGSSIEPLLLIVLSVSESNAAEVVFCTRNHFASQGRLWELRPAVVSGSGLEWTGSDGVLSLEFRWRDANSGRSIQIVRVPNTGTAPSASHTFSRLDG